MTYTVSQAEKAKEIPANENRGALIVYKLTLDTGGSSFPGVELVQLATTKPPEKGDTLEGQIEQDPKFGPRFKKAQKPFSGKGNSRSPAEQKSIVRQGAQQRAALYLIAKALHGTKEEFNLDQFKTLVDKFVEDAAT